MQSSNLVKVVIVACFALSMGCSKGSKDSGGSDTWNPREAQKLLNDIQDYKPMESKNYDDDNVMQRREKYIKKLFPGDPMAENFLAFLNNDYSDSEITQATKDYLKSIISFSFEHRKNLVDHDKDFPTGENDEGIESRMSETDKMSIMFQITQIIGELKKTQSNGQSYWGARDNKRMSLLKTLIQNKREDEIDYQFNARMAGMGVVAVVGGFAFVLLPKAFSKRTWASFFNFLNDSSKRILGLIQKTPLKNIVTKGKDVTPTDIIKYTNPGDIVSRIPRFLYRNLRLSGEARIHYSNTLKIRHHFANLLYSVSKKSPSLWKIKKWSKKPSEEVMNLSEQVKVLNKGIDNIAFNPRFASQNPTAEDHAIHYFVTAHRVSKDQRFPKADYSKMYQDAIDEIDLSKAERSEFKRQFTKLVSDHPQAAEKYKSLAVDTEKKFLLAQKSLINGSRSRKKYGEYGEELGFAWNPGDIAMTEVVYTNTMLNRLTYLRKKSSIPVEKEFLTSAIDLVYKAQKYDVLNISGMRLILKKNKGQVEKVFVGRPMSYSESTVYELATVVPQKDQLVQPFKQSDSMSQEEFLAFMNQTVKAIRDGEVLTRVLNNTEMGMAAVGYLSLSSKVGRDLIAKGLKKNYSDVFDISRLEKGKQANWLVRKFKQAARAPIKRIRRFKGSSSEFASEAGEVWITKLYGKPENTDKVIATAKNHVEKQVSGFIESISKFSNKSIEEDLNLSQHLSEATDDLKIMYIMDAIKGVNKYPLATSLKTDLKQALDNGTVEPEIEAVKSYLKKIANKHIKTQHENMDKVVAPMLKDQEFLAKMAKFISSDKDATGVNLNAITSDYKQRGVELESSEIEVLIELYHSISDFLKTGKGLEYHPNERFITNKEKEINYLNFYEKDSDQWMPSFYDRHFKGLASWTDRKAVDGMILLAASLTAVGIAEKHKTDVYNIDLNSGMFIDDSVNSENWQSFTESNEYCVFEYAATESVSDFCRQTVR